jgi:AraC family transcriptional activator FtrA
LTWAVKFEYFATFLEVAQSANTKWIVPMMKSDPPLVVAIAYDDLCTFEFACAVEVFGLPRPEMGPDWYRFAIAAAHSGPLRGVGGLRIETDGGLELLEHAGTIIIPDWPGPKFPVPQPLIKALRAAHARGGRLVSICAGAFVLAATGLLSGRGATTHWHHVDDLARAFPEVRIQADVLYVDEGALLTSAGSAAALDLCLHLVRRDFGAKAANRVARRLVIPPHREGGQAQYLDRPVPLRSATPLGPLLDHVRQNLNDRRTVARLASDAGMSVRSVHRRFQDLTGRSPGEWRIMASISHARELLEDSTLSIEEIAIQVGFSTAETLRVHFRNHLGTTPSAYRARFATGIV